MCLILYELCSKFLCNHPYENTLIEAVAIPLFTLMGTLCALSCARKLGGGT